MTDKTGKTTDLELPEDAQTAAYNGLARRSDGTAVAIAQDAPGEGLRWWVPDARFSDGWREVTDKDELARLVADIRDAQEGRAQPLVGETGPELVELPEGAEIIGGPAPGRSVDPLTGAAVTDSTTSNVDVGDGTTPEDSTGGGADDPEGDAPGGEATPTAGTDNEDSED